MQPYAAVLFGKNLHRDIEIVKNQRSEKLLKFGGGQKIFIFSGACPMKRELIL